MQNLKSILFATDFRGASAQAGNVAVHLASAFGAHVTLLHVLDVVSPDALLVQQYKAHSEDLLRQVSDQLADRKVAVTRLPIGVGSRAYEIVRAADEVNADMILIGAGELAVGDVYSVGSVAEAVIQHARQPVLAVCPGTDPVRFARILCAVDHSPASREGLQAAVRLTGAFGGSLVVLSVVPPLYWIDKAVIVPPLQWLVAEDAAKTLDRARVEHDRHWRDEFPRFLAGIEFGDARWSKELRQGEPHKEIVAAANEHRADLIVMGTTGRSGVRRLLLGSITRKVLRRLPCSLLAVKEPVVKDRAKERS
jgi:nucleotide-binding universal stress UspA family protein